MADTHVYPTRERKQRLSFEEEFSDILAPMLPKSYKSGGRYGDPVKKTKSSPTSSTAAPAGRKSAGPSKAALKEQERKKKEAAKKKAAAEKKRLAVKKKALAQKKKLAAKAKREAQKKKLAEKKKREIEKKKKAALAKKKKTSDKKKIPPKKKATAKKTKKAPSKTVTAKKKLTVKKTTTKKKATPSVAKNVRKVTQKKTPAARSAAVVKPATTFTSFSLGGASFELGGGAAPLSRQQTASTTDLARSGSNVWKWQYSHGDPNNLSWSDYQPDGNAAVEVAFQSWLLDPAIDVRSVKSGDWEYMIDFNLMEQQNIQHKDHKRRKVRRVMRADASAVWDRDTQGGPPRRAAAPAAATTEAISDPPAAVVVVDEENESVAIASVDEGEGDALPAPATAFDPPPPTRESGDEGDAAPPAPLPSGTKRPLPPFLRFAQELTTQLKERDPSMTLGDIAKKCGELWREMSDQEKRKYFTD